MANLLSTTVNGALNSTGRITASYDTDRYQMNFYRASASNWWVTNDSGNLGFHLNNVGDRFYFGTGGDFWSSTNGWLSTALAGKLSTSGNAASATTASQVSGVAISGAQATALKKTLDPATLPYSCDIYVDGDANTYYPVHFIWGDQDVWRRIIIKRGYGEEAPWDPVGTGVHHGGLLLDWEGNFGGWGGAEYSDRLRVFNESYTNVCADMYIYTHSMGYVFMLRGGHALYHIYSDQEIRGYNQVGTPDIAYDTTSTYFYENSGAPQYNVRPPAPVTSINSSRIDGLRTKKQSLFDSRYQLASSAINTSNIGSQSVNYASSAGSVAWTNVSSRPTALSQFTNDLGNYGGFLTSLGFSYSTGVSANHVVQRDGNGYIYANHINFSTPETENPAISSFITSNGDGWSRKSSLAHVRNQLGNYGNWITTDGRAYPRRSDGTNINFYWSGQGGQPTWLWGSNDGENFYVWNPSNFSVNYAASAGNSTNLDGRSSSRYLYYRGINAASDFQTYQSSDSVIRFDQVNDYNTHSNPPGGYTYGGVLSMRGGNFGFQLWGSHTGDFYFKTQWNDDQYSGWRYVVHSGNIGSQSVNYAASAGDASTLGGYGRGNTTNKIAYWDGSRNLYVNNPESYSGEVRLGAAWSRGGVYASSTLSMVTSSGAIDFVSNDVGIGAFRWDSTNGTRFIVGENVTTTPYTLIDSNKRPVIYQRGQYPVLTLDHTVTSNGVHGPTIQFVHNGYQGNQWVIGTNGPGTRLDIGFSNTAEFGNTSYNPHNGIGGYNGKTLVRMTSAGVAIGSLGTYPTVIEPAYTLDVRGDIYASGTMRAPIFYDSDDTGYYVDPNSNSKLLNLGLGGATPDIRLSVSGDAHISGYIYQGGTAGVVNSWGSRTLVSGGNYVSNANSFRFDNVGYGSTWSFVIDSGGAATASASLRAPIFYDSANTGYYVDPNSTSMLYRVNSYYLSNPGDVADNHSYGIYFSNTLSDAYGIFREGGAWNHPYPDLRIAFHTGIKIGANANYEGVRFYTDYDMSSQVMSINNASDPLGASNVYVNRSLQAGNSLRAPIFYDSDDTGYYLDPNAGTSLKIAGGIVSTAANGAVLLKHENAEANAWIFRENAANWGLFWFNAGNQSGQTIGSYTTVGAELFGMNNAVTGYNPNSAWSGTDASTRASWMLSNYSGYLWTQGTQYSETDMRAPIFYDSQNTAYYLDPNSTSYLYHLVLSGNSYFRPNTWIQFDGNYGVYWPNHYGLHIYPNNDGSYGSLQVKGSKNSWHGIHFDSGNTLMSNANEAGFHQQGVGWKFRWYNGEMYISAGSTGGGTERTVIHSGNIGSQSVSYATDSGSVDGIDSSRIVYGDGERKSSEGYSDMNRYNQASGFYFYNNPSNNPFGDWTNWINVMGNSWASNYGFQLAHQFHGEGFMVRRVTNGTFYSWRTIIDSGNILGQTVNYVTVNYNNDSNSTYQLLWGSGNSVYGTGDVYVNPFLDRVYAKSFETGAAGDAANSYRCRDTGGTSRNAMFVNSSNQLQIGNANFSNNYFVGSVGVNVSPSATAGRIDASNDIVAYSSSDERLKHNITPIENAIDKVKSLTGVEFDWKPEYKHAHGYEGHDTGIIAQQVQEVIPSAVRTNDTGFLAVRYEKLIGLLVEGMKEQQAQIEELKAKLDGLTK